MEGEIGSVHEEGCVIRFDGRKARRFALFLLRVAGFELSCCWAGAALFGGVDDGGYEFVAFFLGVDVVC